VAALTARYGSLKAAESVLVKALREERVRWRGELVFGEPERWNIPADEPGRSGKLWRYVGTVNTADNAVHLPFLRPTYVCRIELVEADVQALSPGDPLPPLPGEAAVSIRRPTGPQANRVLRVPKGRQSDRVMRVLRELHPPKGKVPPGITTKKVWGQVATRLDDENKRHRLTAPSWSTVDRCVEYSRTLPDE
jgi:hypothetical protein